MKSLEIGAWLSRRSKSVPACSRQSCKPQAAVGRGIFISRYSLQGTLQAKPFPGILEEFWASGISGKINTPQLGRRLLLLSKRGAGKQTGRWVQALKGNLGQICNPQSGADFSWDEWIARRLPQTGWIPWGISALGIREVLIISACSIPAVFLGPLGWKTAPAEHVGAELGFSFPPNLSLICAVPAQPGGIPLLEDGVVWS